MSRWISLPRISAFERAWAFWRSTGFPTSVFKNRRPLIEVSHGAYRAVKPIDLLGLSPSGPFILLA